MEAVDGVVLITKGFHVCALSELSPDRLLSSVQYSLRPDVYP